MRYAARHRYSGRRHRRRARPPVAPVVAAAIALAIPSMTYPHSRPGDTRMAVARPAGVARVAAAVRGVAASVAARLAGTAPSTNRETWIRPLPGRPRCTSLYGWRRLPGRSADHHDGTDLGAVAGTPIRAVAAGVVVESGWFGGYGYRVVIRHDDGVYAMYAHASKLLSGTGARVVAGQVIAQVGHTGDALGDHLHLEVWTGDRVPTNPAAAFAAHGTGLC